MKPLISVIVPIYKVESYLRPCVDSILQQTYTNLEIILVDDGSPDRCGAICDEYAAMDSRIKVIHKENGGAASARNVGIKVAEGNYVTFVDGDDWLDPQLYEKVLLHAPFDIALFGLTYVYSESKQTRVNAACDSSVVVQWESGADTVRRLIDNSLFGYACNKVYKADIIKDLQYPEISTREDILFNIRAYAKAASITLIDYEGYFYYQHDNNSASTVYEGVVPDIGGVAVQFANIHPSFSQKNNAELSSPIVKHYLCDMLCKYVFKNRALAEGDRIAVVQDLFANRAVSRALRFDIKDGTLLIALTLCMKLNAPRIFYELAKRIWHE